VPIVLIWLCFLIWNQFYVVNGTIYLIANYDFFANRRNQPRTIAMSSTRE